MHYAIFHGILQYSIGYHIKHFIVISHLIAYISRNIFKKSQIIPLKLHSIPNCKIYAWSDCTYSTIIESSIKLNIVENAMTMIEIKFQ